MFANDDGKLSDEGGGYMMGVAGGRASAPPIR